MKKEYLYLISILLILLIPFRIFAGSISYNDSLHIGNDYISKFDKYDSYIITSNNKFSCSINTSSLICSANEDFPLNSLSGYLNIDEFTTAGGITSYLYNARTFFTMTKSNTNNIGIITNTIESDNLGYKYISRNDIGPDFSVTEYLHHNIKVKGTGTYIDPWIFIGKLLTINLDGGTFATELDTNTFTKNGYIYKGILADWDFIGLPSVSKSGYRFNGWDKNCTSCVVETDSITMGNSDVTITALWIKEYNVTLNKNGGTGGTSSIKTTYGTAMPIISVPTRTGYTFNGYYDATSGGTQYYTGLGASARTWNKTSDSTLYARWTANTYTVTLNKQSGTGGTSSVTATYGSAMPTVTIPTKTGYTFNGYYDATSGGTQYYTATGTSARTWNKATATTLYARWTANTYTVTLNKQSGTGGTSSVTATYGSAMPAMTKPTRTGYTFNGYYDATSGGTQYYTATGTSARAWNKTGGTTLYARWTANQYTVTLNKNGGSGGTSSVTATYGSAMPAMTKPTKSGYSFNGYYTATSGGTQYYTAAGASARAYNIVGATTLYAQWKANAVPTVVVNSGCSNCSSKSDFNNSSGYAYTRQLSLTPSMVSANASQATVRVYWYVYKYKIKTYINNRPRALCITPAGSYTCISNSVDTGSNWGSNSTSSWSADGTATFTIPSSYYNQGLGFKFYSKAYPNFNASSVYEKSFTWNSNGLTGNCFFKIKYP